MTTSGLVKREPGIITISTPPLQQHMAHDSVGLDQDIRTSLAQCGPAFLQVTILGEILIIFRVLFLKLPVLVSSFRNDHLCILKKIGLFLTRL